MSVVESFHSMFSLENGANTQSVDVVTDLLFTFVRLGCKEYPGECLPHKKQKRIT